MNAIQFTTIIGPDGVIHPPPGVELPLGEFEVSIRSSADAKASLETRARELSARRGINWEAVRTILAEEVQYEERCLRRPRPGPGACKGMILYMAPDFDAPLEDMKEYME